MSVVSKKLMVKYSNGKQKVYNFKVKKTKKQQKRVETMKLFKKATKIKRRR